MTVLKDTVNREKQESSKKMSNLQNLIDSCAYPNDHKEFLLEFIQAWPQL